MKDLITRQLTLNLKFEKRIVSLKFDEPTIYNLLTYYSLIEQEKYVSAINIIIPDIKEKDFLSNPSGIVTGISDLINKNTKKAKEDNDQEEGFLPSIIDMMSHRYGTLPGDLMKNTTFTQLMIFAKGYEWNMNIQNNKEKDNVRILMETDDQNEDKLAKELEQAKKDKEILKKMGGMPKIG